VERIFVGEVLAENAPAEFPILIRKTGSTLWKEARNSDQEIADKFFMDTKENSYWEIREPAEVALVAHYLDLGSDDPRTRSSFFVAVPIAETQAAADSFEQVDEDCHCVQLLGRHYNIAISPQRGAALVGPARARDLAKVSAARLRSAHGRLEAAGCRTVIDINSDCVCISRN
jgi:hypothetical protein